MKLWLQNNIKIIKAQEKRFIQKTKRLTMEIFAIVDKLSEVSVDV